MNNTDDWFDISTITEQTDRIVEGGKYGMFLLRGTDRALLVDAGIGVGDLDTFISEYVDTPVAVLLTHTHWDHIGHAAEFSDVYVSRDELSTNGGVRIDSLSDEFTHRPKEFAQNWLDNGNEFPNGFDPDSFEINPTDASPVEPGSEFDLGGRTIELYAAPGHSPGQLVALDTDEDILYGGDVVHTDDNIYAHFQGSDIEAYRETFQRLIELRDSRAFSRLGTSHNRVKSGEELEILDTLYDGLGAVLDGGLDHESIGTTWGDAREYHIEESRVLTPATL